ncbi:chlorohydrolase family protein [Talaromyces stipitatus ATCC 10500]|uniref:Guanine deaminase n=1 Tax=Talaromyces stipitatus (strain ATCC 10500 / CBS 375.48 / QM 6759 / NRRL 1006) TaxID=441959 RepID=B8MNZ2_TALSN|nr:chlorohydrolase family protein [Talaromyces stipitatus ATCC 10500]EED14231.1 chlorohydrolase family protein [Talaromyces stipitatus ATCC 10500]
MAPTYTLYHGTFIQLPRHIPIDTKPSLGINTGVLWVSNRDGKIDGFDWSVNPDLEEALDLFVKSKGWSVWRDGVDAKDGVETVVIVKGGRDGRNGFFFPGFIDTHIHASQYPNAGIFGSSTLLDWLKKYTFPMEKSFGAEEEGERAPPQAYTVYNKVISRTLSHGTTTASYFATIHVPATNLLAALCHQRGQRAFVGRVCMDNLVFCPDEYHDAFSEESVSATKEVIEYIHKLDPEGKLVAPIVTPRFAPTCSHAALSGLGRLASSYSPALHIQTHISENKNEVLLVKELFEKSEGYAHVYDETGLLTPRTILAHAVHLTPEERALVKKRDAKISHCPASNSALGSGLCPVRTLMDDGITIGLGTDVSGGYSPSILEASRQACLVSRLVASQASVTTGRETLSVEEALYLATRGGAQVVDMADQIGGFEKGMYFDAQLIELGPAVESISHESSHDVVLGGTEDTGNVDVFGWENWEEKIAKWVWNGDDRNVRAVWVSGRLVHKRGV